MGNAAINASKSAIAGCTVAMFGSEPENADDATGKLGLDVQGKGRLWYAIEEHRPVAMEQSFEGTMSVSFEAQTTRDGHSMTVKIEMSGSLENEGSMSWSTPN